MKGSITTLTDQLLAVGEIAAAQNHEIETLRMRCERLEASDQALMVALTTFFHILSASGVSTLDSLANVFGNIIDQAKGLDLPHDSLAMLRPIETMLRVQQESGATAPRMELISAQES